MLPFGRVRRRLTIVCDPGEHTFRSGARCARATRSATAADRAGLHEASSPARLPQGVRAGASGHGLTDAPRRPALVGPPRRSEPRGRGARLPARDPLRHVDWRASARTPSCWFASTNRQPPCRVAVFVDLHAAAAPAGSAPARPGRVHRRRGGVGRRRPRRTGGGRGPLLGGDGGRPEIAHAPSSPRLPPCPRRSSSWPGPSPTAVCPSPTSSPAKADDSRATSVVVVAATFPPPTQLALDELGRRAAVTTIWAASETTEAPPPDGVGDVRLTAQYTDDWHHRATLELAP